jgi:hypothetical protein
MEGSFNLRSQKSQSTKGGSSKGRVAGRGIASNEEINLREEGFVSLFKLCFEIFVDLSVICSGADGR